MGRQSLRDLESLGGNIYTLSLSLEWNIGREDEFRNRIKGLTWEMWTNDRESPLVNRTFWNGEWFRPDLEDTNVTGTRYVGVVQLILNPSLARGQKNVFHHKRPHKSLTDHYTYDEWKYKNSKNQNLGRQSRTRMAVVSLGSL